MTNEERYFHVFIVGKNEDFPWSSVELNLNKNNIMWDFIYPIKTHAELYCNGKVYNGNEIKKFKFFSSEQKLQLAEKQTTSDLPNLIMNRNNATEVTRELLEESKDVLPKEEPSAFSNEVFIVHGHDSTSEYELAELLKEDFNLKAIILHKEPNGGKTIIEKLEREAEKPGYVFVLLTPDDIGSKDMHPTISLREKNYSEFEIKHRARQNVILELGYFMGKLGREHVCCLYKGEIELPSDISGILYLPFNSSVNECFKDIRNELKHAKLIN